MKKINFLKAGMENFCCYIEPIDYDFKNDSIRLITGPNGVGKTTIYDSIPYTLYGITTKGLRSDDVVNNVSGKNCHTFVEFTIEEDYNVDNYRVDRFCKHSKHGDTVLLFKNDFKKAIKKGQKEVTLEIEKLIVPQKLFTNTLLFGQKVKNFFTDLTDSDQKEIFRKVLQLDDYVLYHDESTKRIKEVKVKIEEISRKISLNISRLDDVSSEIKLTEERIKNFEITRKEEIRILLIELHNLHIDLNGLLEKEKLYVDINDIELNKKSEEISKIQNELNKISLDYNHELKSLTDSKNLKLSEFSSKSKELLSTELLNKTESLSELERKRQNDLSSLEKKIINYLNEKKELENKQNENDKSIRKNEEEILSLNSALNETNASCPTCGKPITDETLKNKLMTQLSDLKDLCKNIIKEDDIINIKIKKIEEDKKECENLVLTCNKIFNNEISKIEENYKINVNQINEKLNNAKKQLDDLFSEKKNSLFESLQEKKLKYENNLKIITDQKDDLLILFEEKRKIERNITETKIKIGSVELEIKHKEEEKYNSFLDERIIEKENLEKEKENLNKESFDINEYLEILEFWKTGFSSSGIPSLLIDESIPFLNTKVQEYLEKIGGRYIVSFDTISTTKSGEYRDKINVNVLDTKTKANHRKQLSGGQTRVVDIAILLSLCDLQNNVQDMKTNILLLDEIFDSLDDQNIGYISTLLRTLIKDKSINIISHRHIDSIEADDIIRLF